jgi:tetratricopeptide (TPR) repeat protein
MLRTSFIFLLAACLAMPVTAQQTKGEASVQAKPAQARSGFITPSEVNVRIESDVRTFVVMAALNIAGFDYETGGQPLSLARAELRKDLAGLDPHVREKLAAFYKAHRREGVDEAADASRYAALSTMMTAPPGFTIYPSPDRSIPVDLQPLVDFVPLVREFYVKSGIRELVPKYMAILEAYTAAYRGPVGGVVYDVLDYFHAKPETVISMRPLVITTGEVDKKQKSTVITRNRSRQVFIILDPLAAMDTSTVRGDILNQKEDLLARRIGDDYIVIVGPSRAATTDPVRQAMIRFVIDPMVERHLKASLEYKDQMLKLVAQVPAAAKEYSTSVYLIIRESLALATEARLRRINSIATRGNYTEEDAVFDLAQAYLRGAVLAFHFYDSLTGFEKVGIGIEDFFDQMLATAKFDREAARPKEFETVVARVSVSRSVFTKNAGGEKSGGTAARGATTSQMLMLSDELLRQKRYAEAGSRLDEILAAEPNNARALYGMAQVLTQSPSPVELDPKADENDKIQVQHERLERAIKLYRKAIENASKDSERWLIQWSHVFLGRIFDFQEFRTDAVGEYEKAIALGPDVPNGAYKEAQEGKQHPYGQK